MCLLMHACHCRASAYYVVTYAGSIILTRVEAILIRKHQFKESEKHRNDSHLQTHYNNEVKPIAESVRSTHYKGNIGCFGRYLCGLVSYIAGKYCLYNQYRVSYKNKTQKLT